MKRRGVTIVVHTDGDLNTRQYRLPMWAFEAGKWAALVLGLLVVLFFTFAGPISRAASIVMASPLSRFAGPAPASVLPVRL